MLEEILFTTTDTNDEFTNKNIDNNNKDRLATTPNGANSSSENESGFVFVQFFFFIQITFNLYEKQF